MSSRRPAPGATSVADAGGVSHLARLRRSRALAVAALARFPLRDPSLRFLQHGENTTYVVEAGRRRYVLRLHRPGYHSRAAIGEELAWLRGLQQVEEIAVPSPVRSRAGRFVEHVRSDGLPEGRDCSLLEWVHGRFLGKEAGERRVAQLGRLAALLQAHGRALRVTHRRYWDADGLVGRSPRFGAIDELPGVGAGKLRRLDEARQGVHARLVAFARRFPERLGMIHADLHFGNFVARPGGLGAIDFDDCGHGFQAYDLAVPLIQIEGGHRDDPATFHRLRDALLRGYATLARWDAHDDEILGTLVTARRLTMLGWIHAHRDLPVLAGVLPRHVDGLLRRLDAEKP